MIARLVSLDGHPDIWLSASVVFVGRNAGCDVRIDSARVSRRHCCLVLEGDHLVVRDLDSTNGTWVNSNRVSVARMETGDELIIGRARYRLDLDPTASPEVIRKALGAQPDPSVSEDEPSELGTFRVELPPNSHRPSP